MERHLTQSSYYAHSEIPFAKSEAIRFPCLYKINSIEAIKKTAFERPENEVFSALLHARKTAFALTENVRFLCEKFGLENVGFLTITFGHARGSRHQFKDYRKASKVFNSIATNVLNKRYLGWLRVMERHSDGVVHFHALVALGFDIRTGIDFEQITNGDYSSASRNLREEWAFWRRTAKEYRIGRTELLPVRSSTEAMAKYVGKYISKHLHARSDQDKGARLVSYSKGLRACSTRFQFVSKGSYQLRQKIALFSVIVSERFGVEPTFDGLKQALGSHWFYKNRDYIMSLEVEL